MLQRAKRIGLNLSVLLMLSGFGLVGGWAAESTLGPTPAMAEQAGACEDDECEGGSQCDTNEGGNTSCDRVGAGCQTLGC